MNDLGVIVIGIIVGVLGAVPLALLLHGLRIRNQERRYKAHWRPL